MRPLLKLGLTLGMVALVALPARAAGDSRGEIAGGYSYVYDNDSSTSFPGGWFISGGANVNQMFAVVGDISGNYKSQTVTSGGTTATASLKIHTFLVGPRVMGHSGPVTVFGQFLVGAAMASGGATVTGSGVNFSASASDTESCYMPGGGVDVDFARSAAFRFAANERLIRANGQTSKEFQLQIGVVYRFGK